MPRSPDCRVFKFAEALFEHFKRDPGVCNWCFYRRANSDPAEAEAEAFYLAARNKAALRARGHRQRSDGSIEANDRVRMSRNEAVPDYPPPPTDETGNQVAHSQKQYPCRGCNTVYRPSGIDRDNELLSKCARHLVENVRALHNHDDAVSETWAVETVRRSKKFDSLQGQDEYVLKMALYYALKHGDYRCDC